MAAKQAIILIDHGSSSALASRVLEEMAPRLAARLAVRVFVAHMDQAEPTLAQAFESACAYGAAHVVVCPFFLTGGRHVTRDIPALIDKARQGHPGVSVELAEPLGADDLLAELAARRARPHLKGPRE